jgi:hypothetical protein
LIDVINATTYVTGIELVGSMQPSPVNAVTLGINLASLHVLLRALPFLKTFKCWYCCGNTHEGQPLLPSVVSLAAPRLTSLSLDGVGIVGPLREAWDNWESMEYLLLSNNNITGKLPKGYAGMRNLRMFDVSTNHLTGTLPDVYGANKIMRSDLTKNIIGNNIRSNIPLSWSHFSSGAIYVDPPQVHGCLPGSIKVDCCPLYSGCDLQGRIECAAAIAALPLCSTSA